MKDDAEEPRLVSGWALPGSVAVHLVVVLLVVFGLPLSALETEEEQAINVDLVPPPKPPEEAKAEPPPPPPETPNEEAKVEEPPPSEQPDPQPPQQVINPVFQFGDKDAGPRQARDGNSPEEGAASPEAGREPPKQEQPSEPPALTASKSEPPAALPDAPENRAPKPAEKPAEKQDDAKPLEGKKLFSQDDTDDILATAAMGNLPRDVRGGRLCVTELREQLRNAWPPYYPDLLPSFRLEDGATVIDAAEAAFRLDGEWYDLSYRCEVDRNATRVTSFAFRVGDLLPPGERQRRRLPPR